MDNYHQNHLHEIQQYLDNEDLNRTSIRMLDLAYTYNYPSALKSQALELRINYNQRKELGKNKIDDPELYSSFCLLFDEIKKCSIEPIITEKSVICNAKNISKEFTSQLRSFKLNPLDISLCRGNIIGVVGENGNGKTTLLRMIAGDLASDTGSIEYYFNREPEINWAKNKLKIAFVPQRIEKWFGTAYDNLSFTASIKGFYNSENREKTDFIVHRMGMTNFIEHTWNQLSSGYRLRFEITKALIWEPAILILDEPLANLDIQAQELMLNDLRNLANSQRNPISIILSSQQLHEVEAVSDQIIFLKNGRAVFNGNLKDFGQNEGTNTFEIRGKFDYNSIQQVFNSWDGIKIEQTVSAFIITCPDKFTKQDLILKIAENNLELDYYRDITSSTKKLFNDKY